MQSYAPKQMNEINRALIARFILASLNFNIEPGANTNSDETPPLQAQMNKFQVLKQRNK